jgi:hypothetical protein
MSKRKRNEGEGQEVPSASLKEAVLGQMAIALLSELICI